MARGADEDDDEVEDEEEEADEGEEVDGYEDERKPPWITRI